MTKASSNRPWAVILGGSSGIGLATAQKLATQGYNLCVVHRDRKGAMAAVEADFAQLRQNGARVLTFNTNALTDEGRTEVLTALADALSHERVRLLVHAIALGNLKLLAPMPSGDAVAVKRLASLLGLDRQKVQSAVDEAFAQGATELADIATTPPYDNELFLNDEDFAQTIFNMGTSLVTWVRSLFDRKMFAADARIVGLTSEGNSVAWRGYAAVAAAKAALESTCRSIAREFGPHGIRSNVVQAGVTPTKALALIPGAEHLKAHALRRNPLGRLTTPQDVANVIAFLASDDAAWINGSLLRVDGGEHISG